MNVIDAETREREGFKMTFTIDADNNISAFATPDAAAAVTPAPFDTPFETFTSQKELAALAAKWPTERPVAIWNTLPGVKPVKDFKNSKLAAGKIWERIQGLGEPAKSPAKTAKPARAGVRAPKPSRAKGKPAKNTTPVKAARKTKKSPKPDAAAPREGSKTAQVVAMLQRKDGATISEIMNTMGWQKHTVRGFMAGAMKKAGYAIESFKPEGGERTYRINS